MSNNSAATASKTNKYEIDMCNGPLLGKMIKFYFPLMISAELQLLFNAADIIIVGKYAGNEPLAAVGSTGSLINLLVNIFIGLSVGTNVMSAKYFAVKDEEGMSDTVHTSMALALLGGIFLIAVGILAAYPALRLMDTPENVIDLSVLYMRIYFLGMPASLIYNFGASVLRAIGDTKRPLYYLSLAGVINVILNLIFVIVFKLSVAGVAIATVISQCISAALIVKCLIKSDGLYRLCLSKLKIKASTLKEIARIGLPAGVQGALFSISNVLIQSSVNSFGSVAMAGNTAGSNVEGFVYVAMNSVYQTSISFTGQNYGVGKLKRVKKVFFLSEAMVIVIGLLTGNFANLFSGTILKMYSDDAEVIAYGIGRLAIIGTSYFLCGMMDTIVGVLRGMGYSIMPMFVSLTGACLFRIVWIFTIFKQVHTLKCLYLSYPISWLITFLVHLLCFVIIYKKKSKVFIE